jgi:hypothetical protein
MSEWWTYRLSDFLMFSPRTYWRLIENYNQAIWPAQVVALAAGLVLLWLAADWRTHGGRWIAGLLALAWMCVAWAFHWERYAGINWAAQYMAMAFALQAFLLIVLGVLGRDTPVPAASIVQGLGWLMAGVGIVLYPLAVLVGDRPWAQAEVFAVMPEPTALATLGLVLASNHLSPVRRWALAIIPVLSLLLGAATLWTFYT